MKSLKVPRVSGLFPKSILLSVFLASFIPFMPLSALQLDAPNSLEKMKSFAETQHEIVMLLIREKEYDKAATEADKIFTMKWPSDQEPLLLKELLFLSDQLLDQNQASLALQLIDRNLSVFKNTSSHIAILKEKGYLHKSMNQNDKALEYFRKAQSLESE